MLERMPAGVALDGTAALKCCCCCSAWPAFAALIDASAAAAAAAAEDGTSFKEHRMLERMPAGVALDGG
jgi:hypothetical protein